LIHSLDPRVKIILFLVFVLAVTLVPFPKINTLVLFAGLWLMLAVMSRLPLRFLLSRLWLAVPALLSLAFFAFFKGGFFWALFLTFKSCLAVAILVLLSVTTPFDRLLKALGNLGLPKIFILILSFMYRYLFVLEDELMRMKLALKSRSFADNRQLIFKSLVNFSGLFFIRSFERAERIYQAMLSRGFAGRMMISEPLKIRGRDFIFGLCFSFLISAVYFFR
jgi:cobalt/nickel transport system permease protein